MKDGVFFVVWGVSCEGGKRGEKGGLLGVVYVNDMIYII